MRLLLEKLSFQWEVVTILLTFYTPVYCCMANSTVGQNAVTKALFVPTYMGPNLLKCNRFLPTPAIQFNLHLVVGSQIGPELLRCYLIVRYL